MLTPDIIQPFLSKDAKDIPFYKYRNDAIDMAEDIEVHACEGSPRRLLDIARPNEAEIYKQYRLAVYEPITSVPWTKASNVVKKIDSSDNFSINFPEQKGAAPNKNDLKKYLEVDFPFFDSLRNWCFSFFIDKMLEDPNAVCVVLPLAKKDPLDDTELLRPYPSIYASENVYYFEDNTLCVIIKDEKSLVKVGDKEVYGGNIFLSIDRDSYAISTQIGNKDDYEYQTVIYPLLNLDPNGQSYMPAFAVGGIVKEFDMNLRLYKSFFSAMVPMLNEVVRRYSDHQANMALHIHPDRWEMQDTECKVCKGKGVVVRTGAKGDKPVESGCGNCAGTGMVSVKTPFNTKLIKVAVKSGMNDSINVPTPPMGYINRDIASIDFLDKEVDKRIMQALSSINFEFINQQPLVNSGEAKKVDKEEATAFLVTIFKHVVNNVLYPICYFVNNQRYEYQGAVRFQNLPTIPIPSDFNIIYPEDILASIKTAKDSGAPASVLNQLYISLSEKQFGKDSQEHKTNVLILNIDPLTNKTSDEKVVEMTSGGCSKIQFIVSCQLTSFINDAILNDKEFLNKPYKEQKDIIYAMAKAVETQSNSSLIPIVGSDGNSIDGTPNDIEAEAAAKLKGSVGGAQVITGFVEKVSQGLMDRDAAIQSLVFLFKIDEAQAGLLLGPVKKVAIAPIPSV